MTRFGVLLPHFGSHASAELMVRGAQHAEAVGLDSVWVRDHVVYTPHAGVEDADTTMYEALTTLTAVGVQTKRVMLGTGALIPSRHPLHLAQRLATMDRFVGPRRLIVGMGSGQFPDEFEAVGLGAVDRVELVREQARLVRQLWTEDAVSTRDGDHYRFSHVSQHPSPAHGPIPLWYCGNTPRSARLATQFCQGWLAGRLPRATLRARIAAVEAATPQGTARISIGAIPLVLPGRDRAEALRGIDVDGLLAKPRNKQGDARFWVAPPSGGYESIDDLDGMVLYGSAEDVARQCAALCAEGVDHIVFDFRLRFDRWEDQLSWLGQEVLPQVPGWAGAAAAPGERAGAGA